MFFSQIIETPIGALFAISDENSLYFLEFEDKIDSLKSIRFIKKITKNEISQKKTTILTQLQNEVNEYFAKKRTHFSINFLLLGTEFQQKTWKELTKIDFAKTISYAKQAENLGCKKSVRAVANANGNNPISIIIPCHRVIGSNGKLTGYAGGLWRKEWLLKHEASF